MGCIDDSVEQEVKVKVVGEQCESRSLDDKR